MNNSNAKNTRREFLVKFSIGTGVIIGMTACNPMRRTLFENFEALIGDYKVKKPLEAWFEVTADNVITFHSPKVEMGQGAFTGLSQIVAEELEVDIDKINIVHAVTGPDRPIDERSTGGSDSISALWNPLRKMAARMREMMRESAANILGVSPNSLTIDNGVVSGGGKSLTYGEIVQKTKKWRAPRRVKLKNKKDYKLIGKAIPRVDLMPKIIGDPIFGMDVSMPDMLYSLVIRPPKLDTDYVSADFSKAKRMPGIVQIVEEKDFVAVVGKSRPEVEMAARAVKVEWKTNKVWTQDDILKMTRVGSGDQFLIQKEGKEVEGDDVISAEYTTCAGAHAQIEPNVAVADVKDGKAVIYISTQVPGVTQIEVAETLGFKEDQVEIHPTYLGGGFGRKLHTPIAMEAALISKAVGKPVQLIYDRQQEFQSAEFRPPTHHTVKGKVNNKGMIESIEHQVSGADASLGHPIMRDYFSTLMGSDVAVWAGGRINYRNIPNIRVYAWRLQLPFTTTMWRAPGLMANTFVLESFIDELAHKAGKDPVEFRLAHLPDNDKGKIQKRVIETAAKKAGWGKSLPAGRALGIATNSELGTAVAQVAEVSIEDGEIKVHKVTCAIDPSYVINPDGVRAQVEG